MAKRPVTLKLRLWWFAAIACFVGFFWHQGFTPDGKQKQSGVPRASETKGAFKVGLPFSPWLSYKTDDGQPLLRRFSGVEVHLLSASWLCLLGALTASTGAALCAVSIERARRQPPGDGRASPPAPLETPS
jgi:hypothetical protein